MPSIVQAFDLAATACPNRVAVATSRTELTYAELSARADLFARALTARGVRPGEVVALALQRSVDLVVAVLATWRIGAVFVPLDTEDPSDRVDFILGETAARILVTEDEFATEGTSAVSFRELAAESDGSQASPQHGEALDASAYILYTSGSTGRPKGVIVEHANILNTIQGCAKLYGVTPEDTFLVLAPFVFDISYFELLVPVLSGATALIATRDELLDLDSLSSLVVRGTMMQAVPGLIRQVFRSLEANNLTCPHMRHVFTGGDRVPPEQFRTTARFFPNARQSVLYGPTETAMVCTGFDVPADGTVAGYPIGTALPGVQLAIDTGATRVEDAAEGISGELLIGGAGVARGYLNRPDETDARFVRYDGERYFRSGDNVRVLGSGELEYLGRADDQVKIHGRRVELGEIEGVLQRLETVKQAVVMLDGEGDGAVLQAIVVPEDTALASGTSGLPTSATSGSLDSWRSYFDESYQVVRGELEFDTSGWNNSLDGAPIPREEMEEWVATTMARLRAGQTGRVLELGCGSGLLAWPLAEIAEHYHGVDISPVAISRLEAVAAAGVPNATFSVGDARSFTDPNTSAIGALFDTVVINSVSQYFPDEQYFRDVITQAATLVAPGGSLFVGDVRDHRLGFAFHFEVATGRRPGCTSDEYVEMALDALIRETELLLDPAIFFDLFGESDGWEITVMPRRGGFANEMNRFRYDAVVRRPLSAPQMSSESMCWGEDVADLADVERLLTASSGPLQVRGVPNARVWDLAVAVDSATGAHSDSSAAAISAMDPQDALAAAGARPAEIFLEDDPRYFCIGYGSADQAIDGAAPPGPRLTRSSVQRSNRESTAAAANEFLDVVRAHLRSALPRQIVPAHIALIPALPMTRNGKVDRRKLVSMRRLSPRQARPSPADLPIGPLEELLHRMWCDVLQVSGVSVNADFFELGGNSLQAATVIARLKNELRSALYVTLIIDNPTIRSLAVAIGKVAVDARRSTGITWPDVEQFLEESATRFRQPPAAAGKSLFILSAPRSGSTLLRVMLAGHPGLFAPPELELLNFESLADRRRGFDSRNAAWLEGAVRAVMECEGIEWSAATRLIEEFERDGMTTAEFYAWLQEHIGAAVLVDKTVSYALNEAALRRAEEMFDSAVYVHLVRHPRAAIQSFVDRRMDQVVNRVPRDSSVRRAAEIVWTASNTSIKRFLDNQVPAERQLKVSFEELVSAPAAVLRGICALTGVAYDEGMIDAFDGRERRMVDGIHEHSGMIGDPEFHSRARVAPELARKGFAELDWESLSAPTQEVANAIGYSRAGRLKNASVQG